MSDEGPGKVPQPDAGEVATSPRDSPPNPDPTDATAGQKKPMDPARRITLYVLSAVAVVFIWYVVSDRVTPYTVQARVQGLTVPIIPQVSGYLVDVNVRLHDIVEPGDTLMQLDRRQYELAVRNAEAALDAAQQQVGALRATVRSAEGRLGVARAQLDRAQRNWDRVQAVQAQNPGALSQADIDRAETGLAQAVERVSSAEADLDRAIQQLGETGPDNPTLRAAEAALEQAQLNLGFTTLRAPSRGGIESFRLDVGQFAAAGQPLAMFVSTHDVWIEADMRENNISNIEPDDRVEFTLDVAPGRIFKGTVSSVGYGVEQKGGESPGALPTVEGAKGWLRDPQRFPVIVRFDAADAEGLLRVGGQADVIVYTGNRFILNTIGKLRIRLSSLLSYVR
ncbi:MAG: HlyD family secretion protein [Gemmatimonadales bacterium]|jgi:multidrug resistance efflux pump